MFKKCLILDLDNTLWGGISEMTELKILNWNLGIGKSFGDFQMWIKN